MVFDENGIPQLCSEDIELKAEEVIDFFRGVCLRSPQATPVVSFVKEMHERFGVGFDCGCDLGKTPRGGKVLGTFEFRCRTIRIDVSLVGDRRFPFTLAHEFGHLVLHRDLLIRRSDYSDVDFGDTRRNLETGRKMLMTPRDWLEWQANRFAGALLMPKATFQRALIEAQMEMEIKRNVGYVFVENKPYSLKDFNETLSRVASVYNVNKTNVECRLGDLELLMDRRMKDVEFIGTLLREG